MFKIEHLAIAYGGAEVILLYAFWTSAIVTIDWVQVLTTLLPLKGFPEPLWTL